MTTNTIAPYIALPDALAQLAERLNVSAQELTQFANEDRYGGRDTFDFPAMCVHRDEGRVLYTLVRALKPQHILEIGVADGGSSTHILAALKANGAGRLTSYDIDPAAGASVPADLRAHWTLQIVDVLDADLPAADFIFEDAAHTLDFNTALYPHLKTIAPRVIVTHDYYTHEVYGDFYVQQAFDAVFAGVIGLKLDGAFTGLGVWLNPDWQAPAEAKA